MEDGDLDTEPADEPDLDEEADRQEDAIEEEESSPAVVKTFSHSVSRDDPLLQQGEVRVTAPGKVASAPSCSYDTYGNSVVYCSNRGDLYICDLNPANNKGCSLYDITQNETDCFYPSIHSDREVVAMTYITLPDKSTQRFLLLLDFANLDVSFPISAARLNDIDNWDNIVVWDNEAFGIQIFNTANNESYFIERSRYWFNAFPRIYKRYVIWQFHYTNPPPSFKSHSSS